MNSTILCIGVSCYCPAILTSESYSDEDPDFIDHEFNSFVNSSELTKTDVLIVRIDSARNGSSSFSSVVRVDDQGRVTRL